MSLLAEKQNEVKEIIGQQLDIDPEIIFPESTFGEDLPFDAIDLMEMAMNIEEHFNIEINDDDLEGLEKVQGLYDLIELLLERKDVDVD